MSDEAFQPDWFSKPGDTLLTLMERYELTSEDLAKKLGCAEVVVRGLLSGTVKIDSDLATGLSKHVGGTPKFWQLRDAQYRTSLDRAASLVPSKAGDDWIKAFPSADMAKQGWIKKTRARQELLTAYLAYFSVHNPAEWEKRYANSVKATAFRTSSAFSSKVGALSAWLRQGEIVAAQQHCASWNPQQLTKRYGELRVLTKAKNPSYFLPRLRRICAEAGIAFVVVRTPSGCVVSGATRFISPTKAMMIVSFRFLSDDHFWFTFFHEMGHLVLHSDNLTFVDGEDTDQTEMEKEANQFAERALIPDDRRDELMDLVPGKDNIIRFAYSVGVSPGIVVGQLQYRGAIRQNQMNFLKRRFSWDQISAALS
jgi:HTH-type transcriptional regulator / antitoxin HigA